MNPQLNVNAGDLLGPSQVTTPSGLHVSQHAFDDLVKSEANRSAKEASKKPALFDVFSLAQNMMVYGAREKPHGTVQFKNLYDAAAKSFIDAIIIQARRDQQKMVWQRALTGMGNQVGFKVVHDRHDDPDYKTTDNDRKRCNEMEIVIGNPTPEEFMHLYPHGVRVHDSLKDFISRETRAELVIDRKVLYRYKARNNKGYSAFHWLPGESIRPVHEGLREWAKVHERGGNVTAHTLGNVYRSTGIDLTNKAYVQITGGQIVAAFDSDEISIHISNPSDELDRWGYGTSRLEISLDITSTLMYAWTYNRELFKTNYPESILTVSGDYDKQGLEAFKQKITQEGGGVGQNWRLPVIPAGDADKQFKIEAHKLRDTPKDMLFDQFFRMMVAMKCAAYGAHPTIINFSVDSAGSGGLFGHNPSDEIEFSKEHGLKPSLMDMCSWLTDAIVKPKYDDLRVILVGIEEEDETAALELVTKKTSTYMSRNEARIAEGLEPFGDLEDDKNPWNYPNDAPISTYLGSLSMMDEGGGEEPVEGEDFGDFDEQDGEEAMAEMGQAVSAVEAEEGFLGKAQREEKYLIITLED